MINIPNRAIFLKIDQSFNIIWTVSFMESINHDQTSITQDQSSLFFSKDCSVWWNFGKISTADGSVPYYRAIWSRECKTATLSNDETVIYITGNDGASVHSIFVVNATDLSGLDSFVIPVQGIHSIYAYGTENRIITNAYISSTGDQLATFASEYSGGVLNTLWSKKLDWTFTICVSNSDTYSLVLDSLNQVLVLGMDSSVPIIYSLDLTDGSLVGSIHYFWPSTHLNLVSNDISYSETYEKVFIAISFGDAFFKMEYDPVTMIFSNTLLLPGYKVGFITEWMGYSYFGLYNTAKWISRNWVDNTKTWEPNTWEVTLLI